MEKNHI